MSADLQVKVLRVLEEGEFERVGGTKRSRSMHASLRRPTATWRRKFRKAISGKTFFIDCM